MDINTFLKKHLDKRLGYKITKSEMGCSMGNAYSTDLPALAVLNKLDKSSGISGVSKDRLINFVSSWVESINSSFNTISYEINDLKVVKEQVKTGLNILKNHPQNNVFKLWVDRWENVSSEVETVHDLKEAQKILQRHSVDFVVLGNSVIKGLNEKIV